MICRQPPSQRGTKSQHLYIDHCHTTGEARGLLCARCNTGVGFIEQNPGFSEAVQQYLQKQAWNALAVLELKLREQAAKQAMENDNALG